MMGLSQSVKLNGHNPYVYLKARAFSTSDAPRKRRKNLSRAFADEVVWNRQGAQRATEPGELANSSAVTRYDRGR